MTGFGIRVVKFGIMTGVVFCGLTLTCPVYRAVKGLKKVKKGILVVKNITGRQLARVSAIKYRETVWSDLYPDNRHTVRCLEPAVLATESSLELAPKQRQRVVWRMDGGADSDENFHWLLNRQYQFIAKGISNRRTHAWAKRVTRWDVDDDAFLAEIPAPIDWGRPGRVFIKKRPKLNF